MLGVHYPASCHLGGVAPAALVQAGSSLGVALLRACF